MFCLPCLEKPAVYDSALFVYPRPYIVPRFPHAVFRALMGVLHTQGVTRVNQQRFEKLCCLMAAFVTIILIQQKADPAKGTLEEMQ